jgi:hypothetical protein
MRGEGLGTNAPFVLSVVASAAESKHATHPSHKGSSERFDSAASAATLSANAGS